MAASVSAQYDFKLEVTETLALGLDLVADAALKNVHKTAITSSGDSVESATLTGATSPAVSKVYSDELTLTAGTVTIDLTALPGPLSTTMDWTGLKVQMYKFAVTDGNTDTVTIADGNYLIFGDASGQVTIGGNAIAGIIMGYAPETLPDIANTSSDTITITSSDADATIQVLLVAG